jgi:ElaB/YqjD/DUF883 family membrane-anchored ribosome-binding protein
VNNSSETDEIRSEIERTRVEMSETLGEIQDRLRPDHLLQQARDGVTDAAAGKVRTMMQSAGETAQAVATRARDTGGYLARYAQEHPIRVAVAVGAVTWWMLRNRDASTDWYGADDTSWDDSEAMDYGQRRSLKNRVGEYASSARETVGEYASSAKDTVSEYASGARETVGQYAASARDAAGEYAQSARMSARRAQEATTDWVTENPMAAGAIAVAIGAAIGMSLPSTSYEDRMMGEKRDRAWQRASEAARNLKDNVSQKVQSAAENLAVDSVMGSTESTGSTTEPMGRA